MSAIAFVPLHLIACAKAIMASNKHLKVGDPVVAPHQLCNVYRNEDGAPEHECVAVEGDKGVVESVDATGEPLEFFFENKGIWYWDGFTTFPLRDWSGQSVTLEGIAATMEVVMAHQTFAEPFPGEARIVPAVVDDIVERGPSPLEGVQRFVDEVKAAVSSNTTDGSMTEGGSGMEIVYQLRCKGIRQMFNSEASIYSKTVYRSREAAEADSESFRKKCVSSTGVTAILDLEDTPRTIVQIVELELVE